MAPLTKDDIRNILSDFKKEESSVLANHREDIKQIFNKLEDLGKSVAVIVATMPKQPCENLNNLGKVVDSHLDIHMELNKETQKKYWDVFLQILSPILSLIFLAIAVYFGLKGG